jgi:hypothetical protein
MKKMLIVAAALVLIGSIAGAADLKGKIGVGFNYPGVQVRYGITDKILAEYKMQFASTNMTIGARGYYNLFEIPGTVPIIPYVGGEYSMIVSNVLTSGYLTGGFVGVDVIVAKNLAIGGDAGLYWVSLGSTLGNYADYGLIFNAGITYYF